MNNSKEGLSSGVTKHFTYMLPQFAKNKGGGLIQQNFGIKLQYIQHYKRDIAKISNIYSDIQVG